LDKKSVEVQLPIINHSTSLSLCFTVFCFIVRREIILADEHRYWQNNKSRLFITDRGRFSIDNTIKGAIKHRKLW